MDAAPDTIPGKGRAMDDIKIRVIDSKKLIEAINTGSYEINLSAVMALGAVVTQSASRWIPCSERLPTTPGRYLVTQKRPYGQYVMTAYFDRNEFWDEAVAWMPLPEPYKAERE